MIRVRTLLVVLLAACLGCADGGPIGSGISSATISGNVADVEASSAATLGTVVQVSIDEVPGIEDTTDANGTFSLTGNFAGALTLRFTAPSVSGTLPVEVPEGAEVVVDDVVVREGVAAALNVELRRFVGRLVLVECSKDVAGAADLLVNDKRPTATSQFLVKMSAETVLVNRDGVTLDCEDIAARVAQDGARVDVVIVGALMRVGGVPTGVLHAVSIIVQPPPPGHAQPIEQRFFRGTVAVVNCESGLVQIFDDDIGQSRLRLLNNSVITTPNQLPVRCVDLRIGDLVEGRGIIVVKRPDVIEVTRMVARRPVPPS